MVEKRDETAAPRAEKLKVTWSPMIPILLGLERMSLGMMKSKKVYKNAVAYFLQHDNATSNIQYEGKDFNYDSDF